MPEPNTPWPHAPTHRLTAAGTFFVSASTYLKAHHFRGANRLCVLHRGLLTVARDHGWRLEAWAVFSNHYHFVGQSPESGANLSEAIKRLHSKTSVLLNKMDGVRGRTVWFQYWDTLITFNQSYLARLANVHNNPVKHGLVDHAENYPWCSAKWFREGGGKSFVETVMSFKTDEVNVFDDY